MLILVKKWKKFMITYGHFLETDINKITYG